jgi:hypothetical protein
MRDFIFIQNNLQIKVDVLCCIDNELIARLPLKTQLLNRTTLKQAT